jgi:hypothetical protein
LLLFALFAFCWRGASGHCCRVHGALRFIRDFSREGSDMSLYRNPSV